MILKERCNLLSLMWGIEDGTGELHKKDGVKLWI